MITDTHRINIICNMTNHQKGRRVISGYMYVKKIRRSHLKCTSGISLITKATLRHDQSLSIGVTSTTRSCYEIFYSIGNCKSIHKLKLPSRWIYIFSLFLLLMI